MYVLYIEMYIHRLRYVCTSIYIIYTILNLKKLGIPLDLNEIFQRSRVKLSMETYENTSKTVTHDTFRYSF